MTPLYMKREQAIVRDCEHDLYCCLLPRCEALRTCRSEFPIAVQATSCACVCVSVHVCTFACMCYCCACMVVFARVYVWATQINALGAKRMPFLANPATKTYA